MSTIHPDSGHSDSGNSDSGDYDAGPAIETAINELSAEYADTFDADTIRGIVEDSFEHLIARKGSSELTASLASRFAENRLRALAKSDEEPADHTPSVLFLCVHNAGRSQMAAGWMRHLGGDEVDVFSGGSEPADTINQAAVAAMAELGIDITEQVPQPWSDEIVRAVDVVVTMGCGDVCPVYPGKRYVDWELEDPAGQPVEAVRPVRDEIERRVRGLLDELLA